MRTKGGQREAEGRLKRFARGGKGEGEREGDIGAGAKRAATVDKQP